MIESAAATHLGETSVGGTLPSMPMAPSLDTHFLNVDLDIYSKRDLQPLVDGFGPKVLVLFVGRKNGKSSAHLEIASQTTTADATIRAFCRLIDDLPDPARKIWNTANMRSFSIGVQAVIGSPVRDFRVKQATVMAASNVGAEIVLTVYAPARKNRLKDGPGLRRK
jgi:hypothetical protein